MTCFGCNKAYAIKVPLAPRRLGEFEHFQLAASSGFFKKMNWTIAFFVCSFENFTLATPSCCHRYAMDAQLAASSGFFKKTITIITSVARPFENFTLATQSCCHCYAMDATVYD
jgi:hypothetical protein